MQVRTSALSLARLLWWYGEDELWPLALKMTPLEVADLADEFGRLTLDPSAVQAIWPGAPRDAVLLLPVIRHLKGVDRPAARTRRRASKGMPTVLNRSEEERWADPDLREVARILDDRRTGR